MIVRFIEKRMSSRAKRGICLFFCLCALAAAVSRAETKPARILGIEQVQIFTSDVSAETEFFRKIGLFKECPPDERKTQAPYSMAECGWLPKYTFLVGLSSQFVSLWPMP